MSEVNVPLLRKAVEWAEAEAAKPWELGAWSQGDVIVQPHTIGKSEECGTCFCVAGFITALSHKVGFNADGTYLIDNRMDLRATEIAAEALGLDFMQRQALFSGSNTIQDVRRIAESIAGERL